MQTETPTKETSKKVESFLEEGDVIRVISAETPSVFLVEQIRIIKNTDIDITEPVIHVKLSFLDSSWEFCWTTEGHLKYDRHLEEHEIPQELKEQRQKLFPNYVPKETAKMVKKEISKDDVRRIKYKIIFNSAKPFTLADTQNVTAFVEHCFFSLSNLEQGALPQEYIHLSSILDLFIIHESGVIKSESGDIIYLDSDDKKIPDVLQGRCNLVIGLEVYVNSNYRTLFQEKDFIKKIRMQLIDLIVHQAKGDLAIVLNNFSLDLETPTTADFYYEKIIKLNDSELIENQNYSAKLNEEIGEKFKLNLIFNSGNKFRYDDIVPIEEYVGDCFSYLGGYQQKVEVSEKQKEKLRDLVLYITEEKHTVQSESGTRIYVDDKGCMIPDASNGRYNLIFELECTLKNKATDENILEYNIRILKNLIVQLISHRKNDAVRPLYFSIEVKEVKVDQEFIKEGLTIGEQQIPEKENDFDIREHIHVHEMPRDLEEMNLEYENKTKSKSIRPPKGIIPKKYFDEHVQKERLNELRLAIARYYEAGLKINAEWIDEYNELIDSLKTKDEKLVQSDINEAEEEDEAGCSFLPENDTTELPYKIEFQTKFDLVLTSDVLLSEHAKKKIQRMLNTYMLRAGIPKLIYNNHPVFNKATYMDLLVKHHSKKNEENLSIDEVH